jgi:hypothetical protein
LLGLAKEDIDIVEYDVKHAGRLHEANGVSDSVLRKDLFEAFDGSNRDAGTRVAQGVQDAGTCAPNFEKKAENEREKIGPGIASECH